MICPNCQHENGAGAKFCEECASALAPVCANCGGQFSPTAKFCSHCGHATGRGVPTFLSSRSMALSPLTPRHLAERILKTRAEVEGERKQVSVLFADTAYLMIPGIETARRSSIRARADD